MEDIGHLLFQLTSGIASSSRQWQRLAAARLERHGVSGGCIGPMVLIGRSKGGLSQVRLAQQLGVESPSLVRLLDKLATAGLIRRENDASDRRSNRLWLTDKGQAIYPQMEQELTELRNEVFAGLTATEVKAVLKLQRLLSEANG